MGKLMGKTMTLTAMKVRALDKPGMHGDGRGLYLRIAAGGSKGWILRATIDGRRRDIGLGGYPSVSLAKARQIADAHRAAVAEGRDPLAEKRRAAMPTFSEAADKVHALNIGRWRNGQHTTQWRQTLRLYADPVIGKMPLDRIERRDVLAVLTPIWASKPETAHRVRQRIRTVLKWGMGHGYIEQNAAGEAIDGALPSMPRLKAHFRALPHGEVAAALQRFDDGQASMASKLCFKFLVLTAARSGEARGARWSEIDMNAREWRIPADRMKAKTEHRVPLSDAAVAVLEAARPLQDDSGLVFPSSTKPGSPLSDVTLTMLLRKYGLADRATVHGFRSSFRDWCAETGKSREVAEAALAHAVVGVEGAYFRTDLLALRRMLMDEWARYLGRATAKVVQLYG